MGSYIIRRLLIAIPSLVLVSILIAGLVRLQPGDVVMARLADSGHVTDEEIEVMRRELGLHRSFPVQYAEWISGVLRGDLGESAMLDPFGAILGRRPGERGARSLAAGPGSGDGNPPGFSARIPGKA